MVPYAETLQGRLAKALDGRLRVYSFGASGAPLSQYLIWGRHAVREYGAKALIMNVVGNDFDESHEAFKQYFPGFWIYVPGAMGNCVLRLYELHVGTLRSLVKHSSLARYLFVNLHAKHLLSDWNWLRPLAAAGDKRATRLATLVTRQLKREFDTNECLCQGDRCVLSGLARVCRAPAGARDFHHGWLSLCGWRPPQGSEHISTACGVRFGKGPKREATRSSTSIRCSLPIFASMVGSSRTRVIATGTALPTVS